MIEEVDLKEDILDRLVDLHKQATTERSHYYVASCCVSAIWEIKRLRAEIAAEREECAKIADAEEEKAYEMDCADYWCREIAAKIRARGTP